jgi:hypothetical protein
VSGQGSVRALIAVGVTTVLAGIGLAASGESAIGGLVAVPSLVLLIYALHRFGRSGPDDPIDFDDVATDESEST